MTEFNKFYKDKRFYIPVIVILVFELLLQLGVYTPFLKKNSYASNVNRITNHVLSKQPELDPDILILGTSVAYQGLSVRILNEKLKSTGLKVQSIAIPGSELIVQDMAVEKVLPKFKNVKLVIHVGEITMPWVSQTELNLPTLAMIAEFNRIEAVRKSFENEYNIRGEDIFYILFRSIAYRRDMREFFLDPGKRIKYLDRMIRHPNQNPYDYENQYTENMNQYKTKNMTECKEKTAPGNTDPIPAGSNSEHKIAIHKTCALAEITNVDMNETAKTKLYFKRLKIIYDEIRKRNIKIINVFAPYSDLIRNLGGKERALFWKAELEKILGKENTVTEDMQFILDGPKNGDYCYDAIHLNRFGMEIFSEKLGDYLLKNYGKPGN